LAAHRPNPEGERLIGKRADATHRSGQSVRGINLQSREQQEFVVGGVAPQAGADSLVLGVFEQGDTLRYVGSAPPYRTRQASAFLARVTSQHIAPFRNPPKSELDLEYLLLAPDFIVECRVTQVN
jgi:ATP-dependent DNA ligase